MPNDTPTGKMRTLAEKPAEIVASFAKRSPITVLLTIVSMLTTQGAGIAWAVKRMDNIEDTLRVQDARVDTIQTGFAKLEGMIQAMLSMQQTANASQGLPVIVPAIPDTIEPDHRIIIYYRGDSIVSRGDTSWLPMPESLNVNP